MNARVLWYSTDVQSDVRIPFDEDFRKIARSIVEENKTVEQWSELESDDMFQEGAYAGGFDADEVEFCFSYFAPDGELWFQVSLSQVEEIAGGGTPTVFGRRPK